jgi:hypothetical protein
MKKVLMLTMCLTLCAGAAMADHIGLYAENTGINCFKAVWVPDGGTNNVWILQKFNTGSAASEFKVMDTSNAPVSGFFPTAGYLAIGDPLTGASIAYQACIILPTVIIGRIRYADDDLTGAQPDPCGKLQVVPDPGAAPPVLQTLDCQGFAEPATGGSFYWGTGCGNCGEVATTPSTWGSVKALYR